MKRFMFLSIGLLCLSLSALIGFHFGHRTAQATIVAPPAGVVIAQAGDYVLTVNGEIWMDWNHVEWRRTNDIPVPVDQVLFFGWDPGGGNIIVDTSGDYWHAFGTDAEWTNLGQPPVAPVPTENSSWGAIKGTLEGSD